MRRTPHSRTIASFIGIGVGVIWIHVAVIDLVTKGDHYTKWDVFRVVSGLVILIAAVTELMRHLSPKE